MYIKRIFLLLSVILTITKSEYVNYRHYKVYKVIPDTEKKVQILIDVRKDGHFTFWSDTIEIGSDTRIMIAPEKQKEFEAYLNYVNIDFTVAINDVQDTIDAQLRRPTTSRNTNEYTWNYYQNLEEIYEWLDQIAEEHSDVVTLVNMGYSVEGRPIRGIKIDHKNRANSTIGMIEGGIHAREWISPATVTWIIKEFLTSRNPDVRFIAENIVWHIFPVTNPDGYAYTFTHNRMWRKNRSTANFTSCAEWGLNDDMSNGVDLNRNFGFLWMNEQHCMGNFQYEIAIKGMDKLKSRHGTNYIVGTSADILYEVSGSSFDWVKGDAHVPIVYLFELRDYGEYGFLLPPSLIVPNNEEIVDGLVEMDRVARTIGYYHHSSGHSLKLNIFIFVLTIFVIL